MKRILVAGLGLVALAAVQPSFAADRPIPYKALPPAAIFNWTGFYVGADVGYVWSNVDAFEPAAPAFGIATADPNSFTIGGHIGYRYQFPNAFVLGIEGDLSWLDGQDAGAFPGLPPVGFLVNTKWDASVRGILGFAVNRSLFYVTGGASWLNGNGCAVLFVAPTTCLAGTGISSTFSGWTIGGGIAYAFTDNLIGRIEYLHADYGTKAFAGPGFAGGVANVSVTTDKVRAGVSWRFAAPY